MRMSKVERESHVRAIEAHIGQEVEIRSTDGKVTVGKIMLLCGEVRRWAVIESSRMVRMLHICEVMDTAKLGNDFMILAIRRWKGEDETAADKELEEFMDRMFDSGDGYGG